MASFTLAAGSLSSVKNVARSASLSAPQAARAAPVSLAIRAVAAKDVRALGTEEINTTIDGLKRELFDLRMKQATRQEVKNSQFSIIRKDVARMKTVLREREIEAGINTRESRNIRARATLAKYPPNNPVNQKARRNKK
mmetsp:Transcript_61882/g.195548  ORF Transcript_61882/g.195548 Transcript_61882/m.195548 type:complete len:139 (-) Transcript_61882:253-669(-)